MNKPIATLAVALLLSTSSLSPALAADAHLQAVREDFGTKCSWIDDNRHPGTQRLRVLSYVLVVAAGLKAALTVKMPASGTPLKKISYEVHYTPQMSRHIAPSVVVQSRDAQNNAVYTRFDINEMERGTAPGNRQLVTLDFVKKFGHPVNVQQIAIGGNEQVMRGHYYVMDCSICNFKAFDAHDVPLKNATDLNVRVINKDAEPLLLPGQQLGTAPNGNALLASTDACASHK